MAKYLLAFRGGSMPEGDEAQAQVLTAWTAWFTALGGAVADPGNPSTVSRSIAPDGTTGPVGPATLSGYTILNADSLDAAVALASSCPVLAGGSAIEVIETIDVM
jgi:hypothetical protein